MRLTLLHHCQDGQCIALSSCNRGSDQHDSQSATVIIAVSVTVGTVALLTGAGLLYLLLTRTKGAPKGRFFAGLN